MLKDNEFAFPRLRKMEKKLEILYFNRKFYNKILEKINTIKQPKNVFLNREKNEKFAQKKRKTKNLQKIAKKTKKNVRKK